MIGAFFLLFLVCLFIRDFIDSIFCEDKRVIEKMREIAKGGAYRSMTKNMILGQCSQNHDRIKNGVFVLVHRKTGKIEVKESSRPDDGLIASGTRDA